MWASFKRLIDLFGYNAHALFPITEDPRIKLPQGNELLSTVRRVLTTPSEARPIGWTLR